MHAWLWIQAVTKDVGLDESPALKQPRRKLVKQATDDGKHYRNYSFLGGQCKASMSVKERRATIAAIAPNLGHGSLQSSDQLDAVMFLLSGLQPGRTRLSALSKQPSELRRMLKANHEARAAQGIWPVPEIVRAISEGNLMDKAKEAGYLYHNS